MTNIMRNNMKPVAFYPYTSSTTGRFYSDRRDYHNTKDNYKLTKKILIEMFNEAGIRAYNDNKVVFEVEVREYIDSLPVTLYFGFYDWNFSIGVGVKTDCPSCVKRKEPQVQKQKTLGDILREHILYLEKEEL